jgi:hypothetical protein
MLKKDLALALNISPTMVTRLSKRGMPTDTVERAQRWRKRHLQPGRLKSSKAKSDHQKSPTPAPPSGAGDWQEVRGAYVRLFEAAGVDTTRINALFDDLMSLGGKVAPLILKATTPDEKQAVIDREMKRILDLHDPWPLDELIEQIASNLPPAGDTGKT